MSNINLNTDSHLRSAEKYQSIHRQRTANTLFPNKKKELETRLKNRRERKSK